MLNGNGVPGAAANASYLLGQRGYVTVTPPNGLQADAPRRRLPLADLLRPRRGGAHAAALAMLPLLQPAEVAPLPRRPAPRARSGRDGRSRPRPDVPRRARARSRRRTRRSTSRRPSRTDAVVGDVAAEPYEQRAGFPLMVPTVLERNSYADTLQRRRAGQVLSIQRQEQGGAARVPHGRGSTGASRRRTGTMRRCSRTRASATTSAVASSTSTTRAAPAHGRPARAGATYWVVNTLLDSLSNETMLAIAKGLKP